MLQNEITDQTIQNTVDEILRRKEFQQADERNPITEMIGRLWESIQEWVEKLLQNGQQPQRQFQLRPDIFQAQVLTVLKIILIVLAAVLLFFLIRLLVKRLYLNRKIKKEQVPQAHDYLENPEALSDRLKQLIEQKEYTAALRFLFVAVLLEFNEKKIIRVEKWKTNRLYLREISLHAQEMALPMKEFSMIFNECCYGERTVNEDGLNTWLDFYQKLMEKEA